MKPPESDALVFFGATGDLAHKKIFPALQNMVRRGHLNVPVIGVAKAGWKLDQLKDRARDSLVHFGGGVSGHIKLVPKFLQWVRDGYKVYTDTSWAVGFGARWLLTEIEKQGVGGDRVFFGSDEPWSDFDSEYWKLNGVRDISQELKDRVFWRNYEEAFGTHA